MHTEISPETLTIGQLAKRVGLRTSAIRFYEEQGLLEPRGRTQAGYRLYAPEDEQILRLIQRAQRLGFSLAEIRTLLAGWRGGDLSDEAIIDAAESRHLALERQITQLLVMQRELELFLQDLHHRSLDPDHHSEESPFDRLLQRVCANPLAQPADSTLDSLIWQIGCSLSSDEGRKLLAALRDQHVHIWEDEHGYHILVISEDPVIGTALQDLAELEANCSAHPHDDQAPELLHNDEGFLLSVYGDNAFIFARLFLALQRENGT